MKDPIKVNSFAGKSEAQVDVTDEFLASRVPAPNPEAIARAETLLGRSRKATGEDRFAAAVACGLLFRNANRSAAEARDWIERGLCDPALSAAELDTAIYTAYFDPVLAGRIIGDALSSATNDAPVGLGPQPAATPPPIVPEPAQLGDDRRPPSIAETTSSLTAAALVDATTLVATTSSVGTTECALCAARRKAKRERTRRWRARLRNAAQLRGEVADVG